MTTSEKTRITLDQPNAFKSALRIATALSKVSPKWDADRAVWLYTTHTPKDVVINDTVRGLLSAAVLTANNHEMVNRDSAQNPSLIRDESSDTITFKLPANSRDIAAHKHNPIGAQPRTFPAHTVDKQLNTMLKQLSNNWVQDVDGNYRHTQTFQNFRKFGFEPELLVYALPAKLRQPETMCLYMALSDDETRASPPIDQLPKSPQYAFGRPIGVCLNPEQLAHLSQAVGFLNPAREKTQTR